VARKQMFVNLLAWPGEGLPFWQMAPGPVGPNRRLAARFKLPLKPFPRGFSNYVFFPYFTNGGPMPKRRLAFRRWPAKPGAKRPQAARPLLNTAYRRSKKTPRGSPNADCQTTPEKPVPSIARDHRGKRKTAEAFSVDGSGPALLDFSRPQAKIGIVRRSAGATGGSNL